MEVGTTACALHGIALLLIGSIIYDRYISSLILPDRGRGIESGWWAIYVLGAPLVFGGKGNPFPPVLGLFVTRLVFEILTAASGHWLLAVTSGVCAGTTRIDGRPVLAEWDGVEIEQGVA